YHIVVIKSTVPVGTSDRVREIVGRVAKHRADVCSVPEFLKEGSAIEDFMRPDRVVIGSLSDQANAILRELHAPFTRTDNPILMMGPKAAEDVNTHQKRHLVERVKEHFGSDLKGRTFAVWGLAFKPRTDDMREAPSLVVVEELLKAGATVRAHDPEALENARRIFGDRISYH